jgi:hypothetical protein
MSDLAKPVLGHLGHPASIGTREPESRHHAGPAGMPGLGAPGWREAGGCPPSASGGPAPLLPTASRVGDLGTVSAGLVEVQTSDTNPLPDLSFSAPTVTAANNLLARAARLRRMRIVVIAHADLVRDHFAGQGSRCQCIMVTLTYADAEAFNSRQITEYVKRMRRWLDVRRIPYAYEWVLEMQQRGAPHYHVLWWLPYSIQLPMPDTVSSRQRKPLWPWGMSRIERARSGPAYLTKYATKEDRGRSLPRNARLFGVGGIESAKRRAHWRALPEHVRLGTTEGEIVKRAPGGGWLSWDTGEYFPALWERVVEFRDGAWWASMRKVTVH